MSRKKEKTHNKAPAEGAETDVMEIVTDPLADSDMRYRDSVPLQLFRSMRIGIAGLGAVGRQVAILLATMGHQQITGVDPDTIEAVNVGTQGWHPHTVGGPKAKILETYLSSSWSTVTGLVGRFEELYLFDLFRGSIVFCCVDSMAARMAIWERMKRVMRVWGNEKKRTPWLFIDGRVSARTIRILTVPAMDMASVDTYEQSLYPDTEAYEGPCTDRMTVYTACVAAGLMVSQMVNWLHNQSLPVEAVQRPIIPDFLLETTMMLMDTTGVVDVTPQQEQGI